MNVSLLFPIQNRFRLRRKSVSEKKPGFFFSVHLEVRNNVYRIVQTEIVHSMHFLQLHAYEFFLQIISKIYALGKNIG